MIRNYYHLLLVVGVWLLKKLKIFENLSGFQGSATICMFVCMYMYNTYKAELAIKLGRTLNIYIRPHLYT